MQITRNRTDTQKGPADWFSGDVYITSIYLQGIDNAEIVDTVHARRAPMISINASLRL